MVRPERRVLLAGERPVRVSASAPGSRPQAGREIDLTRAGCQEPALAGSKPAGRNKVNASASSQYQPKGVREGRAAHITAKATDNSQGTGTAVGPPRGMGSGTLAQKDVEQERPSLAATSGKDRAYKAGWLKAHGARRESEGFVVPVKACSTTRWREGALLWSSLHGGKREGMPETANNPFVKARQLRCQAMDVSQGRASAMRVGEGWHRRTDAPLKGLLSSARWRHACHIQKIIVKPYAGKPHVRFERGFMETGWLQ